MPSLVWLVFLLAGLTPGLQVRPPLPPPNSGPSAPNRGSIEGIVQRANAAAGASRNLAGVKVELKGTNLSMNTGPGGGFLFRNLAPGSYVLTVKRDGFVTAEDARSGGSNFQFPVTVAAGQAVKNITISMVPAPAIAGAVYDPFGDPLAAAMVQAYARRYTPHGPQLRAVRKMLTNDLGEFRLFWLNFGEYIIGATYGDRALASTLGPVRLSANVPKPDDGYVPVYYIEAMQPPQGQRVRLAPGSDTGNLTLNLHDFSRFRIRGRLISPAPAPNSSLAFVPQGTDLVSDPDSLIRPNADGDFEIRGVSPGSYVVLGTAQGLSSDIVSVTVTNENIENLTIPMVPTTAVAGRLLLEGRSQQTLDEMRVQLVRASAEIEQTIETGVNRDATFMWPEVGRGAYDIWVDPVPAGTYVKSIRYGSQDVLTGKLRPAEGRPVEGRTPDPRDVLQIEFGQAAPNIEGHVEKGSEPAAGAQVVLIPESRFRSRPDRYFVAFADANGDFEFTSPAPGRYMAYAFEQLDPGAYFAFAYNPSMDLRFYNLGRPVTAGEDKKIQLRVVPASETAGGFQ